MSLHGNIDLDAGSEIEGKVVVMHRHLLYEFTDKALVKLLKFRLQLQYCDDFVAVHFAIFHKA